MDRDNRWERIKKAYEAIIEGSASVEKDCVQAIQESYDKKKSQMNFLGQ